MTILKRRWLGVGFHQFIVPYVDEDRILYSAEEQSMTSVP